MTSKRSSTALVLCATLMLGCETTSDGSWFSSDDNSTVEEVTEQEQQAQATEEEAETEGFVAETTESNTLEAEHLALLAEQNYRAQQKKMMSPHEALARELRFLVMDLVNNNTEQAIMAKAIWVEEFVDLHQGSRTKISAQVLMREMLIHEARQYGLNVIDKQDAMAQYLILRGSFNRFSDGLLVNARVVNNKGHQVLSTAQRHLPNDLFESSAKTGYKDGVLVHPN